MTKSGLIIPLWLVFVSGCAFSNEPQSMTEKKALPILVVNYDVAPVVSSADSASVERTPIVAPRNPNQVEIRQMQMRLRDAGFDPGPVDGVAGEKTKIALSRFQVRCGRIQPMLDSFEQPGLTAAARGKTPNRQEVLVLQMRLRNAGFNPGPSDGVWGAKTDAVLTQAKDSCSMSKNFAALLAQPSDGAVKRTLFSQATDRSNNAMPMQTATSQNRSDAPKVTTARTPPRTQEEIRILQLRLRDAGYDPGPFDGVMGAKTNMALEQLEASQRNGKAKSPLTAGITGQY